jgi:hypothetical protein
MGRTSHITRWPERLAVSICERRGSVSIETAVAAPLVIALALGAAEFGNMLYNANMIQTGVRDAARYLARTPDPLMNEHLGRNLATTGTISGEGEQRISWWRSEDVSVDLQLVPNTGAAQQGATLFRGGENIGVVRVSTTVDYSGLGTLSFIGREPLQIRFAHEERWVGE